MSFEMTNELLCQIINKVDRCVEFAIQLPGFESNASEIRDASRLDKSEFAKRIADNWLQKDQATWANLIMALRKECVKEDVLADDLEKECAYRRGSTTSTGSSVISSLLSSSWTESEPANSGNTGTEN